MRHVLQCSTISTSNPIVIFKIILFLNMVLLSSMEEMGLLDLNERETGVFCEIKYLLLD